MAQAQRVEHPQHAVGGGTALLHGGVPLAEDAHTTRERVERFRHIARRVDIGGAGTHGMIYYDTALAANAAGLDKIDDGFAADRHHQHVAGDTRSIAGDDAHHSPLFSDNLRNLIFNTHLNSSLLFLVQDEFGRGSIEHISPQLAAVQQVGNMYTALAQRIHRLQGQRAATVYYHAMRDLQKAQRNLVVGD